MNAEHPRPRLAAEPVTLIPELSEAIHAVPGVVELAPTLTGRALQLGGKLLGQELPAPGQGIEMHREGPAMTVSVDITAALWRPTVATARQVQQVVHAVMNAHHLPCTSVTVSVLALHS